MRLAAIVLAAGKGTRMKSHQPKVVFEACGRPLICYPLQVVLEAEANPVAVVVGYQAEAVIACVKKEFPERQEILFPRQTEMLGTGHAVLAAREAVMAADRVLILNGDLPLIQASTIKRLTEAARKVRAPLAIVTSKLAEPGSYGRVVRGMDGQVERVVEYKDAAEHEKSIREVNVGVYLAEPRLLFGALSAVGRSNAQREYYLTDIVSSARNQGWAVATVDVAPEEMAGVNDRLELAYVNRVMRDRNAEHWMRHGVTILDPAVTYIEGMVRIGEDTLIEPMVTLDGKTRVGKDCVIGQGAYISDAEIADNVTIRPYSHIHGAKIGKGCMVGPFANLRPGTVLGDGAHVGNYVEMKKTTLGKGSKANHLTYLGDAEIGAGVNIGAGTITCNYDGVHKHPTHIADGAFIGSDTTLVAPVTVGKEAFVGAGSTITHDVPPGALAVGRSRQVNKEGWVRGRKKKAG